MDESMTFSTRLRMGAEKALIFSVQLLIILAVLLAGTGWVFSDYFRIRQMASSAFEVTQQIRQQSQQRQQKPAP